MLNIISDSKISTCLNLRVGNLRRASGTFCYIKACFGTIRTESARKNKKKDYIKSQEIRAEELIDLYVKNFVKNRNFIT